MATGMTRSNNLKVRCLYVSNTLHLSEYLHNDSATRMMVLTNLLDGVGSDRGKQGHYRTSSFRVGLVFCDRASYMEEEQLLEYIFE